MRQSIWMIVAFLLVGAALLTYWPQAQAWQTPVPPGQYPLNQRRPQWPLEKRSAPYHPKKGMGSDKVKSS